jgi:hypothetical protein
MILIVGSSVSGAVESQGPRWWCWATTWGAGCWLLMAKVSWFQPQAPFKDGCCFGCLYVCVDRTLLVPYVPVACRIMDGSLCGLGYVAWYAVLFVWLTLLFQHFWA